MTETKGHCKHGEFILTEGCSQCIAERKAAQEQEDAEVNSPTNIAKRIKEAEKAVAGTKIPPVIIKVQYYSESTGELSPRQYTYYSVDPLSVGDIVIVPVRDTTGKAKVSAVGVPEAEIANFKDKVKTIPPGSKMDEELAGVPNRSVPNETEAVIRVDPGACLAPAEPEKGINYGPGGKGAKENILLLAKPEADTEVVAFYNQSLQLRDYAEARIILTNEDLKPANDDLIIIREVRKGMEEKRKEYLRPFQDHVKETNEAYKTFMEPIEQADKITAGKMLEFSREQDKKRREAEAIEAEKLELAKRETELKGEHTIDLSPVEKPEVVPSMVSTDLGTTNQKANWKWEVIDFALVPDEYKMINPAVLTPAAKSYKDTRTIPGIRIYNEPIIARGRY